MGILISLENLGIIKAYSLGAPQSTFTIIFYVSLILYGIVFGLAIWNEKFHWIQALGVVLSVFGLFLTVQFRK